MLLEKGINDGLGPIRQCHRAGLLRKAGHSLFQRRRLGKIWEIQKEGVLFLAGRGELPGRESTDGLKEGQTARPSHLVPRHAQGPRGGQP